MKYEVEIGARDNSEWCKILDNFDDSNIYQTKAYGEARWAGCELAQLMLRRNGEVIAAAQVAIMHVPVIGGIAYIRWGPLWKKRDEPEDFEIFKSTIIALKDEFVCNRGLCLYIIPREIKDRKDLFECLIEQNFICKDTGQNTIIMDISGTEEEIRSAMKRKWRAELRRAIGNRLEIVRSASLELYDRLAPLYEEMYKRKSLDDYGDLDVFRSVLARSCCEMKLELILAAEAEKGDGAGAMTSAMGNTGLPLVWATNLQGRESRGAYLLQWEIIKWLKRHGCVWYDLGGVNKGFNPGGYLFKSGLAGKAGREVCFLGDFICGPTKFHGIVVMIGFWLRNSLFRKHISRFMSFAYGKSQSK